MHNANPDSKNFQILKHSADILIIVRTDVPSFAVTVHDGVQTFKSTILLKGGFLFGRYNLAHAIGAMVGCGLEEENGKATKNIQSDPF